MFSGGLQEIHFSLGGKKTRIFGGNFHLWLERTITISLGITSPAFPWNLQLDHRKQYLQYVIIFISNTSNTSASPDASRLHYHFLHLQERRITRDESACRSQVYLGFEIISTSPSEEDHLLNRRLGSTHHLTIFWNFSATAVPN